MNNTILETRNLCFRHKNSNSDQIYNISLTIYEKEFISIIGPSWVGKSTLLDLLAWLETPTTGQVLFRWQSISHSQEKLDLHTRNNVWILFQNYGLFPWLNVKQHLEFWLANIQKRKIEKENIINEVLDKIWLLPYKTYYPHQLSWWMQQRLATGSILANNSPILLMDEPFSAIDVITRHTMQDFLKKVYHDFEKTIILVTHQIDEALLLSDRIFIMWWKPWSIIDIINLSWTSQRDIHSEKYRKLYKHIYNQLT